MESIHEIAAQVTRRCARCFSPTSQVTVGFRGTHARRVDRWIGRRIIVWPEGVPPGPVIAVVSSRTGRQWDRRPMWFAAIRHICALASPDTVLMTVASTATAQPMETAVRMWDMRHLSLEIAAETQDVARWLRHLPAKLCQPVTGCPRTCRAFCSPPLDGFADDSIDGPMADRLLLSASDARYLLFARRGGNIHRLARRILAESAGPADRTFIATSAPGLVPDALARELVERGAQPIPVRSDRPGRHPLRFPGAVNGPTLIDPPAPHAWPYLSHWTRRADGPWPNEPVDNYWQALLAGSASADRSPVAALTRILSMRRLVASANAIRGGSNVVCFSAVPVTGQRWRRQFRPHRNRWDFESYGLCIRRKWLKRRGARRVQYGSDADWQALLAGNRPFFQCINQDDGIDWRCEREYRIVGDVELDLGPADALVFCANESDARRLLRTSPWPVFVVP